MSLRTITSPLLLLVPLALCGGCDDGAATPSVAAPTQSATTTGDAHAPADGHDHGGEAAGETDEHGHAHGEEHADEVKLTPEGIRRSGIRLAQAKTQTLTGSIIAPARVAFDAEQVAHVSSVVSGRVTEIKARVGDNVKRGDVLLVVDSTELGQAQSDFLQRRTAVETAKPAVELAKSAYDRAKQLYDKSQGISLTEVQKRQGEWQAAQGALATAKAAATAAENRLHLLGMQREDIEKLFQSTEVDPTYRIRAPIEGRVIEREVTLGELVSPEKERLMVLADLREVWVLADVPEAKLGQISLASKASVTVPALGDQAFEGVVSYIAPELDPATRTARVRIEVKNPEVKLLPGMFARAEIAVGAAGEEPVVAVAEEAVQTVEDEPSVFVPVEGEPNTFAKRAVGIGQPIDGMVPVYAGLKPGERYVAAGSFILKAELGKAGAAHEH